MTSKIEQALIEYSRASARVKDLGTRIGEAISASKWKQAEAKGGDTFYPHELVDWLANAYLHVTGPDGEVRYEHHDGNIEKYLGERCMYALLAHQLIQERKQARQALGIAKRRVNVIAKKLAAQADADGNRAGRQPASPGKRS